MAVTGFLLLAFLILHMIGNLKIFFGQVSFDHYADWLRTLGSPLLPHTWYLWIQRGGLVVIVGAHILCAVTLTLRDRRARPVKYSYRSTVRGAYSAATMRWSGLIILLFVVYHLLDLSALKLNPNGVEGDVYANTVADFKLWYVTLAYTVAMVALGLHIDHGFWSAAHTLGVNRPRTERVVKFVAHVLALGLTAGFLVVPIAVLSGVVR